MTSKIVPPPGGWFSEANFAAQRHVFAEDPDATAGLMRITTQPGGSVAFRSPAAEPIPAAGSGQGRPYLRAISGAEVQGVAPAVQGRSHSPVSSLSSVYVNTLTLHIGVYRLMQFHSCCISKQQQPSRFFLKKDLSCTSARNDYKYRGTALGSVIRSGQISLDCAASASPATLEQIENRRAAFSSPDPAKIHFPRLARG